MEMEIYRRAAIPIRDEFAGESTPPLDDPAGWGPSWACQLDAACAWQAAAAQMSDDADQWCAPDYWRGADKPALSVQTVVRLNTLNVALRERLLGLMSKASDIAIAEMAQRQGAEASAGGRGGASPPALGDDGARRLDEVARAWFELIDTARANMSALTGMVPGIGAASGAARPLVDRRQQVVAIDFADRRKAG